MKSQLFQHRFILSIFLLLVASTILLSSCTESPEQSSASTPILGVSVMTSTNPFFMKLGGTIREEAAKHGYETILVSGDYDVK